MGRSLYFKSYVLIVITLVSGITDGSYNGDFDDADLSTLGQRIANQVNAQVAPLHGLGQRITDNVNKQLRYINSGQMQTDIQASVQQNLAGLNNLGEQISQNVYASLEPVRALEITANMKNGVGGSTIVKHLPSGTTFLVQNYKIYKCSGQISSETGQCQGNLTPYEISTNDDGICYITGYSRINDKLCFAAGGVSVSIVNNVINCQSNNGSPAVLLTVDEYKKKCDNKSKEIKYTYFPNLQDPSHVQLPSQNKHVKCDTNSQQKCEFTESHSLNLVSGSNIIINGGNVQYYSNTY